ncbi:Aste57867_22694 [Aphanomyces stellatus]|uniref:Aste57867_22694 protein n=1 Tax=Aphanomyces stellatus TaxID=120398 RepID=A0A485LKN1_9STRA|nr:hypothetical protein As57867_022624 [Aphanomyces stellatus]VFT99348.1 Aste57867_22694 [Aphanomyces stellatus]
MSDDEGGENDIVLGRADYDLLQAFHRLFPLPALSSGITRVICDEELQIADEEDTTEDAPSSPTTESSNEGPKRSTSHLRTLRQLRPPNQKPHHAVDLSKLTPRTPERPESS